MRKFLCVLGLLTVVLAQDRPNQIKSDDNPRKGAAELRSAIFKKYDSKSLPVKNPSKKVTVTINVEPIFIRKFDENSQIFSLDAYLEMKWKDEYLRWNSESNHGIERIVVPSDDVWTPDIAIAMSSEDHLNQLDKSNVVVQESGDIFWSSHVTLETFCPMNVSRFPEDVQVCRIQFRSQSYDGSFLTLIAHSEMSNFSHFNDKHKDWTLLSVADEVADVNMSCCLGSPFSGISYNVELKRKVPEAMETVAKLSYCALFFALLMFWLPPDSLHKVLLGSVSEILLTMTIFYLGRTLPSEETVQIAACRTYILMCFVAGALFAEVLVICMARMLVHCRPSRCLMGIAKCCCQPFCICASRAYNDPRTLAHGEKSRKPTAQDEWNVIATAFDRLLFLAAILLTVFYYKFY